VKCTSGNKRRLLTEYYETHEHTVQQIAVFLDGKTRGKYFTLGFKHLIRFLGRNTVKI